MVLTILLNMDQWSLFFGKFHPLLVHLPIGFIVAVFFLEIGRLFGKIEVSDETISFILLISAITAISSCVAGYFLLLSGGYDEDILDNHKWQGIWVAIITSVLFLLKTDFIKDKLAILSLLNIPLLGMGFVLLMTAGHLGGSLTHGEGYLTQETPEPFRSWLGIAPKVEEIQSKPITDINKALAYQDVVHPILKQNCFQCHNATKSKGKLRMDVVELLKKGGKNGEIFKAGNSAESEMIKRCLLPLEDENHMPPKGKPQLTDQQLSLISWWIDEGANFDKKVVELKQNDNVKPILASLAAGAAIGAASAPASNSFLSSLKVSAPNAESISKLRNAKLLVQPLASDQPNLLELNAVNASDLNDEKMKDCLPLSEQIVWLKLNDTKISDKSLEVIGQLKNLQKLNLENTSVTDNALKNISKNAHLEYLNLVGTAITDESLNAISACKNLTQLYIWKTKTTAEGIAKLKTSLPKLQIDTGISEAAVADFIKLGEKAPKPEEVKAKK